LRATVALNPAFADAHARLGLLLLASPGARSAAVGHLESALRLQPAREDLLLPLADALAEEDGREADALRIYAAAAAHAPMSFAAQFNAGNLLLRLGRFDDASTSFAAAIRVRPDYAPAHSNLGLARAQMPGGLAEAARHFEAALKLDPSFDLARRNLARVRAALEGKVVRD
jgi:tetratricopeptide (TPR) repeat protein